MVVITRKGEPDDKYRARIPAEKARVSELRRIGFITQAAFTKPDEANWRVFFEVRSTSREDAERELSTLPLADRFEFQIMEIQ